MSARFEVVRVGPRKFHARFKSDNEEIVWVTESYRSKRTAIEAIHAIVSVITVGDHMGQTFVAHPMPLQFEETNQPIGFSFTFVDEARPFQKAGT